MTLQDDTVSFSVDMVTLAGLPTLLDRLAEDARSGAAHLDAGTDISWTGEGLINILSGGHRNVQDQVRGFLQTVEAGVASPTAAVRASLTYYTDTDHANAKALDRTYPSVTAGDVRQGNGPDATRSRALPDRLRRGRRRARCRRCRTHGRGRVRSGGRGAG